MQFRIQDLIKNLIPALTFLLIIMVTLSLKDPKIFPEVVSSSIKDLSAIIVFFFLGGVYVLGYFLDTLASLLEYILYKIIEKPSFYLLNDSTKKYKMANKKEIMEVLCSKQRKAVPDSVSVDVSTSLFKTANVLKDHNPSAVIKERISEYYSAYIFSRNLMLVILICFIVNSIVVTSVTCSNACTNSILIYFNWILFFFLFLAVYRWREKAFYYSRQVFYGACY